MMLHCGQMAVTTFDIIDTDGKRGGRIPLCQAHADKMKSAERSLEVPAKSWEWVELTKDTKMVCEAAV